VTSKPKEMEQRSFTKNAFACILASLIITGTSLRVSNRFLFNDMPPWIMIAVAAIAVLGSVTFSIIWYLKDKRGTIDSTRVLAIFQGLLRYGTAFELCFIGWQKIFHLQFITPLGRLDNPFSSFPLSDLMWAFFGQSYSFILVIGFCQIIGSFLLLFSRTRLLGVFILIPILLNIILIDIFYEIEPGPLLQATLLFSGVLYFLLIEYDRLKKFFFFSKNDQPSIRLNSTAIKNIVRFSVVIIPLIIILPNKKLREYIFQITQLPEGRYEVRQFSLDEKDFDMNDRCDSVLTMVYLSHDILFQYGSTNKRLYGLYNYDENTKHIKAVWHFPFNRNDTLNATVTHETNGLIIDGKMGTKNVRMKLVRTEAPKYP
jgi:hypothetical protein